MKNTIITVIMAATILIAGCGKKSPGSSGATDAPLAAKVTLAKPYPVSYEGGMSDKISLQDAVMALAEQAKLGYDFGASQTNAGDVCRKFITPEIEGVPLREALARILEPEALTYDIQNGKIVLKKK